eukprot:CAMPEP_0202948742 /NCGR_PEP_ID=MMETSP1395-20130829/14453_1 /ASSEMBLY_ACC=CAM_ASM_000871 /TAXON_ID=5961 /ORGANISM="Blepharisma japonicum, Strain Stock R1072" /LENGTH=246 /DNA_ID=CAMNT_0049651099 /DNA_START=12 /DNA_END=752 /DNA_ORIENTATION=+
MKLWRRLLAETYGTAALTFVIFASHGNAFAVGIGFWVIIVGTGFIGGAHFNPTVTLGALIKEWWFTKTLEKNFLKEHLLYFLCQIVGALFGALLGTLIAGGHFYVYAPIDISKPEAYLAEAAFTGHLVLVVLVTSAVLDSTIAAGMAIAFTVLAGIRTVGGISGGCFNPTVCIAIDIVQAIRYSDDATNYLDSVPVYIIGPLIGVGIGVLLAIIFLTERNEKNESFIKSEVPSMDAGLFSIAKKAK